MRIGNKIHSVLLGIIAVALCLIAIHSIIGEPKPVSAQTAGIRFGYLLPQAGNTQRGGTHFIDVRNGNSWDCNYQNCKLDGGFPLEQIK
jgi:hypothetical protein